MTEEFEKNVNEDLLDENGNLKLYSYDNGGGFVYNSWKNNENELKLKSSLRPDNTGGNSEGLLYFHNGDSYYTKGGSAGRIQAYGGCKPNTISEGQEVLSSEIVVSMLGRVYPNIIEVLALLL